MGIISGSVTVGPYVSQYKWNKFKMLLFYAAMVLLCFKRGA